MQSAFTGLGLKVKVLPGQRKSAGHGTPGQVCRAGRRPQRGLQSYRGCPPRIWQPQSLES